jgi:hypothetical protein
MRKPWTYVTIVSLVFGIGMFATAAPAGASSQHRHWYCNANDTLPMTDMTDQQMMDEATFYPMMKGRLSNRDCRALSDDLRAARRYANQFPTAADAIAGGFHMIVPYVHGMGAHYIGPDGIPLTVNPQRPNFLLYGGNGPDAPLVGLMWLVNSGQAPPPDGLPGGNDHWHRHSRLCLSGGLVVGDGLPDATCSAVGGINLDTSNLWMLHAWFIPGWYYKPDVFRPHHPMLMDMPPMA